MLFRAALACVFVALAARGRGGVTVLRAARPRLQILRGAIGCCSMLAAIFAYSVLPLADVLAVVYSAPILVTLLSVPLLGEAVGARRLAAAGVGFVGVLLIVQPGRALGDPVVALPLLAMVCYALSVTLTRILGRHDSGLTTLIHTQAVYLAVCLPAQPFVWVTPTGADLALFAVVAGAGAAAQAMITSAYTSSPPAAIAPFDYTTLLWATLLGYLIWGDFPDAMTLSGMAIVVASGVYIAYREFRRGRAGGGSASGTMA